MPHSDSPRPRGPVAVLMNQPYLLLVLAPLFWGGNVVAAKLVVGEIDAYLLLASRCVGATALIACLAWRDIKADRHILRRTWPLLMGYGIVGYALFNVLLYLGVTYTTAVNSSIVQAALPVMILGANFLVFRVRTRPVQIIGVAIAILGVLITATGGQVWRILTLDINVGDGLVILACLCYTAYTLALKYRPAVRMMSFLAVAFCGAMLFSLVLLQLFGGGLGRFATLGSASPTVLLAIIYVATLPSLFSQIFYARGVEMVGANRAGLTHNLIPLFGALGSILILGERFELFHAIAATVIIAGIVLSEWSARRI